MNAVAPKQVERLGKLLALLSSPHDGERANAAAAADRQLRGMGMDWPTLAERGLRPPPRPPSPIVRPPPRRQPSTETVLARLEWLLRGGWPYPEHREGVRLIALFDGGGPFTAAEVAAINATVRRVEAASGCPCGTEIPL